MTGTLVPTEIQVILFLVDVYDQKFQDNGY